MQTWKDGVLAECTTEEFVQSLYRHAGWADEEFNIRSDPAANLGLLMSQAAGHIDVLTAARAELLEALEEMVQTFSGYQGMQLVRAKAVIEKARAAMAPESTDIACKSEGT